MTPVSHLPRLVILAAVAAKFDLADLFCYEITPKDVALISSSTGQMVRVDRDQLRSARLRRASRKFGPAPIDARSQPAPGRAVTGSPGPCDPPEGSE